MTFQEKLAEIIREIENMDDFEVETMLFENPYSEKTKETALLYDIERGVAIALHLAEKYNIDKEL